MPDSAPLYDLMLVLSATADAFSLVALLAMQSPDPESRAIGLLLAAELEKQHPEWFKNIQKP